MPAKLACVVCGKSFVPNRYNLAHQKTCTPAGHVCDTTPVRGTDGVYRRKACACCRDAYKRSGWNKEIISYRKILSPEELRRFLAAARKVDEGYYWAFRLCVNAMLRVGEVRLIRVSHFSRQDVQHTVSVPTLKRHARPEIEVAIDRATHEGVLKHARSRGVRKGLIFTKSKRSYQHWAKTIMRNLGLKKLSTSHILRHTGISMRARAVRSVTDLAALQQAARHTTITITQRYIHALPEEQMRLWGRVQWAK